MEGFANGVYVLLRGLFSAFFYCYQMTEVYAGLLRQGLPGVESASPKLSYR